MGKKAVSVTLEEANLLWLKGQAAARGSRSLSHLLDELVTDARESPGGRQAVRSVVGSIDIDEHDPALESADAYVRTRFEASTRRPLVVKETRGKARG